MLRVLIILETSRAVMKILLRLCPVRRGKWMINLIFQMQARIFFASLSVEDVLHALRMKSKTFERPLFHELILVKKSIHYIRLLNFDNSSST